MMNFEQYRLRDRARYVTFVEAIRHILAAAVKDQEMVPHAITGRAKDPDSLEKKLEDHKIDKDSAIDERLKDLAGVRIVFLTNAQVQRFLGSGVIHDNFDVISVNVHHAVPGTETETKLFSSTNYFLQLKAERLALPEYAPFEGLKAEVQVQTLLNHAWAEMDHDTFYKEPAFKHVDRAQFERIKARMDAVMREHLLPAGHDFDKVARDMATLLKADEAFDPAVDTIRASQSNDEIATALETLDDVVMPHIADRRERFAELLPRLVDAVDRTRGSPATKIDTVLGPYDGATGEDVARRFAELLHHHRYCDPERTLPVLFEMYAASTEEGERRLWLEQGRNFAEHDLDVWRTHGPANQRLIVDGIAGLGAEELERSRGIVLEMLRKVLSSEVSGTSRGEDLNTLQIHQGTVAPSDALKQVRSDALDILEGMLQGEADDVERSAILHAMRGAARPPFHGGSIALRTIVVNDAARVASAERAVATRCGLEVRRQMEVDALHVHSWYGALPPAMADEQGLIDAQRNLVAQLLGLRDDLNSDADFVLYKAMIGHDSVRPAAWTGDHFDYEATEVWRQSTWADTVALIDREGAAAWTARARRYLSERAATGGATPLSTFTEHLAMARPDIALHQLREMDEDLAPLLLTLLVGLDKAGRSEEVRGIADAWTADGTHLATLAHWLLAQRTPDPIRLAAVASRALTNGGQALLACANAAARLWGAVQDQRLISDVFMPAVSHFTAAGQTGWTRQAWEIRQGGLVAALDEAEARALLASFAEAPEIDYDGDRILATVADRWPQLVLDFFEGRVRRDRDRDGSRFDPIPFRIHDSQVPLSRHPRMLLTAIRRWHDLYPQMHQFRGGRLAANVFPTLPADFGVPLAELVAEGDRHDLAFVLETLRPYDGLEAIYPLCMDVVDRLDDGDGLLRTVSDVLGETGVIAGEFGLVAIEGEQHGQLGRFLEDPRPKVRAFAQEARRRAEQSMAWEQRRAEQDVEQMRRDWN